MRGLIANVPLKVEVRSAIHDTSRLDLLYYFVNFFK